MTKYTMNADGIMARNGKPVTFYSADEAYFAAEEVSAIDPDRDFTDYHIIKADGAWMVRR